MKKNLKKALFFSGVLLLCGKISVAKPKAPKPIIPQTNTTDGMGEQYTANPIKEYTGGIYTNPEYGRISSWDKKNDWNLINIHDPSVAYWEKDGYYYMYQTDASYGNAHDGHGHFYCRRSKDLVNWSSVGMALPQDGGKYWALAKINEFRKAMNLNKIPTIEDVCWLYWAPTVKQVTKSDGQTVMRMYYAIGADNFIYSGLKAPPHFKNSFDNSWGERALIGLAECSDPAKNDWVDKGYVLCSSSAKGSNFPKKSGSAAKPEAAYYRSSTGDWSDAYFFFNAIDPTYFIGADGKDYLIYGSWHHGFAGLEIDRDSGFPKGFVGENVTLKKDDPFYYYSAVGTPWADNPEELAQKGFGKRIYCRGSQNTAGWQPSEGPEVIFNPKDQKYYLFFANDGLDIPYHTRVVRSENPLEGYVDMCGLPALQNRERSCYPLVTNPYKFEDGFGWVGISHCTVFEYDGDWYYCSQGRMPPNTGKENPKYSNAFMTGHVRKILWCPNGTNTNDLWPISSPERYAGLENRKTPITEKEIVGRWEHINLVYRPGLMDKSAELYFNADHTISGAITGTWSFDAEKKYITLKLSEPIQVLRGKTVDDKTLIFTVDRECDWELSSANGKGQAEIVETLVYAGIASGTESEEPLTFWGKKSQ